MPITSVNIGDTVLKSVSNRDSGAHTTPEDPSVQGVSGVAYEGATTTFVDDGQVTRRDESMIMSRDRIYDSINDTQGAEQKLIDFLQKPILLHSGNFSDSDTYSFLQSYSMPYYALTSSQGAMYLEKLKGYFGIAMDMRFRIVINATRFQQGRYCIGFVPTCSSAPSTSNLKQLLYNNMHMATLIQRTTVPHVEIDIATGTSAELLVPFMSANNFYPINSALSSSDMFGLGFVNVYPYKPLVAASGVTTASYTLYVSFENVKLFGAASPQSGLATKKNRATSEISNRSNGPVSSVANAISSGFKEFSSIPLIGSYANDISWIADRVSNVASIFGFSKPIQGDSLLKVMVLNAPSHTNVDGDSDVRTLSLLSKPGTVQIDGLFGTDYDEMDFSYVSRKYAWFKTIDWTYLTTVGNLSTIQVRPSIGASTVAGAVHLTPVAFLADQFVYWRGSLKFKFKLVKTEFHSGRLSFSFFPIDEAAAYTADPYYVNRIIVDIRDTNEVELVIPYIARNPWKFAGDAIGILSIDVVDMLIAPDTVSNTISLLVETCGGDDFEVAVPAPFNYGVTCITPQSGMVDLSIVSATIGNSTVESDPLLASSATIGDKVSSFRTLLKRFTPLSKYSGTDAFGDFKQDAPGVFLYPDIIHVTSAATSLPTTYWNTDRFGLIASCYGMVKGGIRIRDVLDYGLLGSTSTDTTRTGRLNAPTISYYDPLVVGKANGGIGRIASSINSVSDNLNVVLQQAHDNNVVTLEIPQYTSSYARTVCDMMCYQSSSNYGYDGTQQSSTMKGTLSIIVPWGSANTLTTVSASGNNLFSLHNLYRSAAEDTSFGVFISVPPLVDQAGKASGNFY